jgi:protein-S-isoprenylcysteine O-methyltransferase Ste14
MEITIVIAYLLIAGYFVIERLLRKNQQSLNLKPGVTDGGSSYLLWFGGSIIILLVIAAPMFNSYRIGYWNNSLLAWLGLMLMLAGLILRFWAAKTLGEFYTRTLQIVEGQKIIDCFPYNSIRHPGYLGTFLIEIGAGLAVKNWLVLSVVLIIAIVSRIYRISVEEKMLEKQFGREYKIYSEKTWRLLPFIY